MKGNLVTRLLILMNQKLNLFYDITNPYGFRDWP